MNRQQYTEVALKTALPTALNPAYLGPMIVGEVGEMFGARGKSVRDEWNEDRAGDTLAKELGDVAWGTVVLISCTHDDGYIPHVQAHIYPTMHALMDLALKVDYLAFQGDAGSEIGSAALRLWTFMETASEELCGYDFDTVLKWNIEKLRDRQARGVLQGSGDDR